MLVIVVMTDNYQLSIVNEYSIKIIILHWILWIIIEFGLSNGYYGSFYIPLIVWVMFFLENGICTQPFFEFEFKLVSSHLKSIEIVIIYYSYLKDNSNLTDILLNRRKFNSNVFNNILFLNLSSCILFINLFFTTKYANQCNQKLEFDPEIQS